MKSIASVSVRIFAVLVPLTIVIGQQKKPLSADQIFRNAEPRVLKELPGISRWLDDARYLEVRREGDQKPATFAVDARTGKATPYKGLEEYVDLIGPGVHVSAPAAVNDDYTQAIYVKENDLYHLNTRSKTFKRLTESPAEEKNPTLSPDSRYVAFTRDNDLFAIELGSGKEKRYTSDGSDVVYSGWASWVYYEEILGRSSRYKAFWWSPDGKKLAFYRFDDSKVPMFPIYGSTGQHGYLERTRYPKAGDLNPEVRIGITDVTTGAAAWADFDSKEDQYFGPPFWTPDSRRLLVQWMNRGQDTLIVYAVEAGNGKKRQVYFEHQPSWVEWLDKLEFPSANEYIIRTDKDGWMHLYRYGMNGVMRSRITSGKWTVTDVHYVDKDRAVIYFSAKKEASTRTDLYKVGIDGKNLTRLTFGPYTHSVRLSPGAKYFITSYSNATTPSRMAVYDGNGKAVRELGDSKTPAFDEFDIARSELFTIPTPDGYNLPAVWTLPTNFDPNKKYPVLVSVYGGPNAPTVSDTWRGVSNQWLAQEGMIQISFDHRSSGHFGKEGVALMYRNLGKWEMNDYIEAVKWLRTKPFVDSTKICITGGSYGGYVTAMALTYGADYFTHGIAISSVTDWKLYDTHYTERYMDTPAENPEGYAFGSVMTHAPKYKGMLRIVHGTMDDNVHMQNSIQLVDTLQE
ncbi:MAG: DPP IV N-terminal domain-containing protein, partial [Ignavibacteriales bacterium]|nr:DPP IV N-terminal domain-containing protein [Ignavibacteriales bacterium]